MSEMRKEQLSLWQCFRRWLGFHAWTSWGQCRGCGVIWSSDPVCQEPARQWDLDGWRKLCAEKSIEWIGN